MKKLFDYLMQYGGQIVSSNNLTSDFINQAKASDRMYVDENGLGFVWEPDINRIPETENELEVLEKWYPIKIEMPEALKTNDWLFNHLRLTTENVAYRKHKLSISKSHKEIIEQFLPDGGYGGINNYNENKISRMITQAILIDKLGSDRFSISDMIEFSKFMGSNCTEKDLNHWINEYK